MRRLHIKFFSLVLLFILLFISVSHGVSFAQETNSDCSLPTPTDAPNLYQITSSSGSATLYFAQPVSEFDGYVISYALTDSADAYSVKFKEGKLDGAVKYVIHDLFPKTNYFFKVRATNGCSAGPWSSTLGTNNKSYANLPETGPQNTLVLAGIVGMTLALVGVGLLFVSSKLSVAK